MYIIEAALEYLISLLVTGSYLATITKELGLDDGLTGILSAITSLGCLFQILSISYRRTTVKGLVVTLSIINQLLFCLLYVIPIVSLTKEAKTVIFIVFIVSAYIFYNFAHPKKIAWLMSLVDDGMRGSFTATKEIVSLISGMLFSFGMGALIDSFTEAGRTREAFIICAAVILALMILHTVTLSLSVEKERKSPEKEGKGHMLQGFIAVLRDKSILKITAIYVIYQIATFASLPFFGTYMIGELNMTLTTITALSMVGSIARIFVSRPLGRYADKRSFAALIEKCFLFLMASFVCVAFATPRTGIPAFALYNILHGIAMGGINSSLTNLIFDYAPEEKRADALVISQSAAGVIGFLTSLTMSGVVRRIQEGGNTLFGMTVYAQQLCAVISFIFVLIATVYVRVVIIKKENK